MLPLLLHCCRCPLLAASCPAVLLLAILLPVGCAGCRTVLLRAALCFSTCLPSCLVVCLRIWWPSLYMLAASVLPFM
jgi:hypothetical protein